MDYDHELINQLNNHYNKNRHIQVSSLSFPLRSLLFFFGQSSFDRLLIVCWLLISANFGSAAAG